MKYFLTLAFILICSAASLVSAQNSTDPKDYWLPVSHVQILLDPAHPEQKTLISRWNKIGADLAASPNGPGGTYEFSSYRGYFLRWSAQSGYVYVYHSEGLSIIDFSYGRVRV